MPHCLLAHGSARTARSNLSVAYISVLFPRSGFTSTYMGIDISSTSPPESQARARDREALPPRSFVFFALPPAPPRCHRVAQLRCDRPGRRLISRLMSFLITPLLPAALFIGRRSRPPAPSRAIPTLVAVHIRSIRGATRSELPWNDSRSISGLIFRGTPSGNEQTSRVARSGRCKCRKHCDHASRAPRGRARPHCRTVFPCDGCAEVTRFLANYKPMIMINGTCDLRAFGIKADPNRIMYYPPGVWVQ
jgi:hypothetical protein